MFILDDLEKFRELLLAPIIERLNRMENNMATKQDLDAMEQTVLTAVQALATQLNAVIASLQAALAGSGFDTAPEIATLQQIADSVSNMAAKLTAAQATGTTPVIGTVAPVISSSTSTSQVGVPFSYQVVASQSPTNYTAVGLPAGLSINASNGLISGTPSVAGSSVVNLEATNAVGSGTSVLVLTVNP